jgi:formylglycine-generating enzyme required for sulfatase activity
MKGVRKIVFLWAALSAAPLFAQSGMVLVEGGTFRMGRNLGPYYDNAKPAHRVTVGSFYMARYEVTQKEWTEIMGTTVAQQKERTGSSLEFMGEGDNYPIYAVSWYEAVEYCNRLSIKEGLIPAYRGSGDDITCDFNATGYRLPTEAEWEYAARGGNKGFVLWKYSGGNNLDEVAWYWENGGRSTHPVGTKKPNRLGLYDMTGNVLEWCWDRYKFGYTRENQMNPAGPSSGAERVLRGDGWLSMASVIRLGSRGGSRPHQRYITVGFRVVRSGGNW